VAQKNLHTHLIGNHQIEVRGFDGEVADQLLLGGGVGGQQRNSPGPFVLATAPLCGKRLAGRNGIARAIATGQHRPICASATLAALQKVEEMYSPKW